MRRSSSIFFHLRGEIIRNAGHYILSPIPRLNGFPHRSLVRLIAPAEIFLEK
jgi:hypothetical protein